MLKRHLKLILNMISAETRIKVSKHASHFKSANQRIMTISSSKAQPMSSRKILIKFSTLPAQYTCQHKFLAHLYQPISSLSIPFER